MTATHYNLFEPSPIYDIFRVSDHGLLKERTFITHANSQKEARKFRDALNAKVTTKVRMVWNRSVGTTHFPRFKVAVPTVYINGRKTKAISVKYVYAKRKAMQ